MLGTKFWVTVSLLLAFIAGLIVSMLQHRDRLTAEVEANAPIVQTLHYPDSFAKQIKGNAQAGAIVYHSYCVTCHAKNAEIPVRAPRLNQKKLWLGLRSLGREKLLENTVKGIGAMPARGGCFECDDESLRLAIDYMLSQATGKGKRD
jgi:cytochrome c5